MASFLFFLFCSLRIFIVLVLSFLLFDQGKLYVQRLQRQNSASKKKLVLSSSSRKFFAKLSTYVRRNNTQMLDEMIH
jgi:hypothetical protein